MKRPTLMSTALFRPAASPPITDFRTAMGTRYLPDTPLIISQSPTKRLASYFAGKLPKVVPNLVPDPTK